MFAHAHHAQSRLLWCLIAITVGIAMGQWSVTAILLICATGVIAFGIVFAQYTTRITLLLVLIALTLGFMRAQWNAERIVAMQYEANAIIFPIEAEIVSFPQGNELRTMSVRIQHTDLKLSISTRSITPLSRGDVITIDGIVVPQDMIPLSYQRYLSSHGLSARIEASSVEVVSTSKSGLWRFMTALRSRIEGRIARTLPQQEGSFITALLLGSTSLPRDLSEDFRNSGLQHIVAVSGTHVTMLALFLSFIARLSGIPRTIARSMTLITLAGYIVLVGAPSSAIRAGVMGSIGIFGLMSHRRVHAIRLLLYAATVIVFLQPMLILGDVGFQLSVFAMIGLIAIAPRLERFFPSFTPDWLRTLLAITLGAQIATFPIILAAFERFSLYSVIANIITVPLTPVIFGLVGIVGASLVFPPFIISLAGIPAVWTSAYIIWVAKLASSLPYSSIVFTPPFILIASLYIVILIPALRDLRTAFTVIPDHDINGK